MVLRFCATLLLRLNIYLIGVKIKFMKLAIFGAGSLGKEILSLVTKCETGAKWEEIIFIDDVCELDTVCDVKKYTYSKFKDNYDTTEIKIVIATGEPKYRKKIYNLIQEDGYELESIICLSSYIGERTRIDKGTIVFPNVYISNDTVIGCNCIVHANAKVESGCIVKDNTFVSSGAFVGADTELGDSVFVGPNSALFDHISIGNNSLIGIGSVVTDSVPNGVIVVGNPARK
jgi:sugar O-acyltransferase (sialic acid O-acetyltransferase NeuD family)